MGTYLYIHPSWQAGEGGLKGRVLPVAPPPQKGVPPATQGTSSCFETANAQKSVLFFHFGPIFFECLLGLGLGSRLSSGNDTLEN